ncbi:MAG: hypothetical protein GC138_07310 [Gammaproteobacteria bacterium]|nr:hypothetical protein [Gammaproteobacteria bacterium]
MRRQATASIQHRGVCMRFKPFGNPIAVRIASLLCGLALSLPVWAGLAVDAQGLFNGNSDDEILDAVADSAGNVYVTGWTSSTSVGSQSLTIRGSRDVFVAKFDASGALLATQVFGGGSSSLIDDGNEQGTAIALDLTNDHVFVTGAILGDLSSGIGLPTGIIDRTCRNTLTDAFLLVLQSDLTPSYFTCFGDANVLTRGQDIGQAIAVDGVGDVFLSGSTITNALDGGFPKTTGTYAPTSGKSSDGFVLKLSDPVNLVANGKTATVGSGIIYSTLLGGASNDEILGLAIDGAGQAYVTGMTISLDFPVTVGSLVTASVDVRTDAFFARLSADGSNLSLSGLVGGNDNDQGNAIALDATSGDIYVTGETRSTDLGGTPAGGQDAFVARIANDGSLGYLVYLGTTGNDRGLGIVVDQGVAVVAGLAGAGGLSSPLADFAYHGGDDGFVARLNTAGIIAESAYIGSATADQINSLRLTGAGHFVVAGRTASTTNAQDGFLFRLTYSSASTGGNPGGGGTINVTDPGTTTTPIISGGGGALYWPLWLIVFLRRSHFLSRN